jgi:hypothetical protein
MLQVTAGVAARMRCVVLAMPALQQLSIALAACPVSTGY